MLKLVIKEKKLQENTITTPSGVIRAGKPFPEMPKAKVGNLEFDVVENGSSIYLFLTTNQTPTENAVVTILPLIIANPVNLGQRQRIEKYKNTIGEKPYFVKWINVADNLRGKRVGYLLYDLATIKAKRLGATHLCSDKRRSKTVADSIGSQAIWDKKVERDKQNTKFYDTINRFCTKLT